MKHIGEEPLWRLVDESVIDIVKYFKSLARGGLVNEIFALADE